MGLTTRPGGITRAGTEARIRSRAEAVGAAVTIGLLGFLALVVAGCGERSAAGDEPVTLTVSAASDLRFAFGELGALFEQEAGVRVTFNFGSSGQLAMQIEQGAPVDLFASADVALVERLAARELIVAGTQALYARGFLVLWRREGSPEGLESVEGLLAPAIRRVAIANPAHAPYGRAAREALENAGLWPQLEPKMVYGENVSQALQYAQTGNVDAAVVALSLAVATQGGRYTLVPQELHAPIDQGLGVVTATAHGDEARAFADFINGPVGRPVMERYGFLLPPEVPGP